MFTYNELMTENKHLNKIRRFYHTHKRMPSYREIMALTGLKSLNSVFRLIQKMISLNLVSKDAKGKIIPGKSFYEIPLLGLVEAGFPSPSEEELVDTMTLDEYLINNKEATYMLKVTGDSMIEAGIMPGDIALVERGVDARNGDIVIARIDGEWTIKYLRKKGNKVFLEAANKDYKPIFPKDHLEIAAIVKAVIRKY